jgi:hypothetical protein
MTVEAAEEALSDLTDRGLLQGEILAGTARYSAAADPPELVATMEQLAGAYTANRLDIMNLMSANAVERVRNSAIRAFAKAFDLGKKSDG